MNKIALCIPRPGTSYAMINQGYVDALRYLGWVVYVCDPKTKLECKKLIEKHDVRLIMTHSRFGMRQLPIDTINTHQVAVIINALPMNLTNDTIDGPHELAHDDESSLIKEIQIVIVHTHLEPNVWSTYMHGWLDNSVDLVHLPLAGNLIKAMPPTCDVLTDVAMVANFTHRQDIMKGLIEPLFKRLELLGFSYQAFGDNIWQLAGLSYNGPLNDTTKLAHVYATAKICSNVHTEKQIRLQACINERSFMIPLCGGIQVSDNPLAAKYLGPHCEIGVSTTDYMNKVVELIEDQSQRLDKIKGDVEHVAHNHTYFNSLSTLFDTLGLLEFADEARTKGQTAAVQHCWGMDARLSATERGVIYEQQVIGAT